MEKFRLNFVSWDLGGGKISIDFFFMGSRGWKNFD